MRVEVNQIKVKLPDIQSAHLHTTSERKREFFLDNQMWKVFPQREVKQKKMFFLFFSLFCLHLFENDASSHHHDIMPTEHIWLKIKLKFFSLSFFAWSGRMKNLWFAPWQQKNFPHFLRQLKFSLAHRFFRAKFKDDRAKWEDEWKSGARSGDFWVFKFHKYVKKFLKVKDQKLSQLIFLPLFLIEIQFLETLLGQNSKHFNNKTRKYVIKIF
jgi:hypothetical protein